MIPVAYLANAQDYKLYIDNNGSPTDVLKATSYVVVKQLADTGWLMQNYDLENIILQSGTFKDRNLQIQNGKFVYYRRLNFYNNKEIKESLKSDTVNYITTEGLFKDGKKDGRWTDYFTGGKVQQEVHYKNGVLNGPYRSYNDDQTTIALSGSYVNGLRDGNWEIFGPEGEIKATEKYHKGKMLSRKITLGSFNFPKPPDGFDSYVKTEFRKAASSLLIHGTTATYSIIFAVTADGKIIEPESANQRQDHDPLMIILLDIIKNSPLWQPGDMGDKSKPVEDLSAISVEIDSGIITIKVLDYDKAKGAHFNLIH
ncbi:MAG: hypothetical protein JSU01_11560 [Bacteroidetes bacterium]|nr:hypothetical protein [Bacteroidota bacterium]